MSQESNRQDAGRHEQPISELLKELSGQFETLLKQELTLARAEMGEKGKQAGYGIGMVGIAGLVGLLALGLFTVALVFVLATVLAPWLAVLILAGAYALIAGVLAVVGKGRVSEATPPVPEQTVDTAKENIKWASSQVRSARK